MPSIGEKDKNRVISSDFPLPSCFSDSRPHRYMETRYQMELTVGFGSDLMFSRWKCSQNGVRKSEDDVTKDTVMTASTSAMFRREKLYLASALH